MNLLIPTRPNGGHPVNPIYSLSRELDRLFESPYTAATRSECQQFAPALELRENQDSYQVSVELPGVDRKDVEVTLHDGVLSITGERKQETEVKEDEYVRTERAYGRFQRQVALPQPVNADSVKAAYKDGVLIITLPKSAEARPKPIVISAN